MTASLVVPDVAFHDSFAAGMAEFAAEGRGSGDERSSVGDEIRARVWSDDATFGAYVARLRSDSLPGAPRETGRVACTTLWWVDGEDWIGRLAIRHELTEWLEHYGGHIGYDVRASRWREGHATAMLAAALPVAWDLGVHPALVTCDVDNVGSRTVIERAGGELEDERGGKLRFWVGTRPARHAG